MGRTAGGASLLAGASATRLDGPLDNFIEQVDLLHAGAPNAILYAGDPNSSAGYVDGTITTDPTVVKFNQPYSIDIADGTGVDVAGTIYVADQQNDAIRKIAPRTSSYIGNPAASVSTLMGGSLHTQPDEATFIANFSTYQKTVAPWPAIAAGYCLKPACLRMTSTQNFALYGLWDECLMHVSLSTNELILVGTFRGDTPAAHGHPFSWLDVDRTGACGPVDSVILGQTDVTQYSSVVRFASLAPGGLPTAWAGEPFSGGAYLREGYFPHYLWGYGSYFWSCSLGRIYGTTIGNALGATNPALLRIATDADLAIPAPQTPPYGGITGVGWTTWFAGTSIYDPGDGGTYSTMPYGVRPSFWNLMGPSGAGHYTPLTGSNNTYDDLATHFITNIGNYDLHPGDPANAGTLVAHIQAGLGGAVPRPELTGNTLRNMVYQMMRTSHQGSWPTVFPLPSYPSDPTPPVITITSVSHVGNTLTVTWDTDKPTMGVVCAGSPAQYAIGGTNYNLFGIEVITPGAASYKTTGHTATVDNLPAVSPIHYSVQVRDLIGGNPSHTLDGTVT